MERKQTLLRLNFTKMLWPAYEALESGPLVWPNPFVQPFWLRSVTRHLGAPGEPLILAVRNGDHMAGVAPVAIAGDTAALLGDPEVCDYQDLVCAPGDEIELLASLTAHLSGLGIRRLVFRSLRPESVVLRGVQALAAEGRLNALLTPDGASFEADLAADWEGYLLQLNGKQRHEVRRKLRRLESGAHYRFRLAPGDASGTAELELFFELFGRNRADKAAFMTPVMKAYFKELAQSLAARRMLRLYIMEVQDRPAAAVFCFDHQGVRYLYNSAYDAAFEDLSVGVLCKLLSIQAAIASGCRRYDFLKGAEPYKKRIGGHEVPLTRCDVVLG